MLDLSTRGDQLDDVRRIYKTENIQKIGTPMSTGRNEGREEGGEREGGREGERGRKGRREGKGRERREIITHARTHTLRSFT